METSDLLKLLWRRRWIVALCVAVSAGSALAVSSQMTPQYEARAKVFVGPRSVGSGDAAGAIQELTFSREFVASYAEILKSRPLAEKVVEKTGASTTGAALAERVDTKIIPETRLIEVTVQNPSAGLAQLYANEIVQIFASDPDNQFGGGGGRSASVFEPALLPTEPVSPKPIQNGLIGGLLGGMLGVGLVFLMERLDTAIRSREDAEKGLAPLPVIGQIPMKSGRKSGVFVHEDPHSPQAEALRIFRTNVQFVSVDKPVKTVLVTSPFPSEGKTTVAANLAAAMGAVGSKVLLVETDLRKPVLHDVFDLRPTTGLANVLAGQVGLERAVQRTKVPNLSVLTAGSMPPNPSELLGSQRMVEVIEELKNLADTVIFDTTPALPVTDASVLAPHMDGVVLVVRAGRTPINRAQDVVANFLRHDVRMLGVVVNGLERDGDDPSYYSYRYYRRAKRAENGRSRWGKSSEELDDREFLNTPKGPSARHSSAEAPAVHLPGPEPVPPLEETDFEPLVSGGEDPDDAGTNGRHDRTTYPLRKEPPTREKRTHRRP